MKCAPQISVAIALSLLLQTVAWAGVTKETVTSNDVVFRFMTGAGAVSEEIRLSDETRPRIIHVYDSLAACSSLRGIIISSGASLEGAIASNRELSVKRSQKALETVKTLFPDVDANLYMVRPLGEDYEGLLAMVKASDIRYRDEIIDIIENVPIWVCDEKGSITGSRKQRLMDLHGGAAWHEMERAFFPAMRTSTVEVVFGEGLGEEKEIEAMKGLASAREYMAGGTPVPAEISRKESTGPMTVTTVTYPVDAYFVVSETDLRSDYLLNTASLSLIDKTFLGIYNNPDRRLTRIGIRSGASPEGPIQFNFKLSDARAAALQGHILSLAPDLDQSLFDVHSTGENYEGLREILLASPKSWSAEAIDIIDTTPAWEYDGHQYTSRRKYLLQQLDGGKAWDYMLREYYPWLRRSRLEFSFESFLLPALDAPVGLQLLSAPASHLLLPAKKKEQQWAKRTVVAFKTNLLYDAVTALNYQIEVPVGQQFSLMWEHYFPWWATRQDLKYCLQYLTLGGEARWWFLPRPRPGTEDRALCDVLTGHFLGAYGLWGKTDIQWKRSIGMYQCTPVWSAGLTYGYAMPVSEHLNLEFSLSVGYARIPYQHYVPSDDWQVLWRDTEGVGVLHYFGPTKVAVTLAWPILVKYRVKEGASR